MKKYTIFASASLLTPLIAFAQERRLEDLLGYIGDLIEILIILVAAIALLVFFWGLAKFIFKIGGDEDAIKEGRNLMKWGIIALFVMMSVWGIIRFFQEELGLDQLDDPIDIQEQFSGPTNV